MSCKDISSSEGGITGWGKLRMRAGREKVEGILLDGFILLYKKRRIGIRVGKRPRFGKVTWGEGKDPGTNGTILGGREGSGDGGGNDVWVSSLQNLREKMNGCR